MRTGSNVRETINFYRAWFLCVSLVSLDTREVELAGLYLPR